MHPKVTIITASFNSERTIASSIESILKQNYKNLEYLIIDGGSTDNTLSIIKENEKLFGGRLKWISEKDKGIYDAWNKGLNLSTGDWISFLGSDDILFKNAIENYVIAINNNPDVNFISSMVMQVTQNLNPIRSIGKPWSNKMKSYNCIAHVGSLHSRNLFIQKGLFNTKLLISGDYDFLLRCYDIIKPLYLQVETAYVREGGISGRNILRIAGETLKVKITNKSRPVLVCFIEYFEMIFKFYARMAINSFS